ncbi:GTPase Era [Geovibrio sp. ADMFC3]|jgi:GTP-binding protein Era
MPEQIYKSGFVSILGRPNVGKSTLINSLIGEKIAIVSNKPQTTRTNIQGIKTGEDYQIVFIDTPGYHKAKDTLNRLMVQQAADSIDMADILFLMVQADEYIGPEFKNLVKILEASKAKKFLVINKLDIFKKEKAVLLAEKLFPVLDFAEVVPISARKGTNVDLLLELVVKHLPEGMPMFDSEEITTVPEKMLIAEYVREQVFEQLQDELPYRIVVETESVEDTDDGRMEISASIIVERESHKGMVIGKQGARLKEIGTKARLNLEKFFGVKIHLALWVKIRNDWADKDEFLRIQGLR